MAEHTYEIILTEQSKVTRWECDAAGVDQLHKTARSAGCEITTIPWDGSAGYPSGVTRYDDQQGRFSYEVRCIA